MKLSPQLTCKPLGAFTRENVYEYLSPAMYSHLTAYLMNQGFENKWCIDGK